MRSGEEIKIVHKSLTIFEYAAGVKKVGLVVEGNRRWLRLIGVVTRLGLLLALNATVGELDICLGFKEIIK